MDSDKTGKNADWNSGNCTAKEMLRLRKLNPWAPEHPGWVVTGSAPSECSWCMHQTWRSGSSQRAEPGCHAGRPKSLLPMARRTGWAGAPCFASLPSSEGGLVGSSVPATHAQGPHIVPVHPQRDQGSLMERPAHDVLTGLRLIQKSREMVAGVLLGECSSCAMEGMAGEPGVWPAVELRRGQGRDHQGELASRHIPAFVSL